MSLIRLRLLTPLLAGLLLAASAPQPSHAEMWTAKGVVTELGVEWQSEISIGADVYMQIEVDLLAPDLNPEIWEGEYEAGLDFVVLIEGNSTTRVSTAAAGGAVAGPLYLTVCNDCVPILPPLYRQFAGTGASRISNSPNPSGSTFNIGSKFFSSRGIGPGSDRVIK